MAVTGKGDFPFQSTWAKMPCQLYRGLTWADDDDAPKDVWSDWFFESAGIGGPQTVDLTNNAIATGELFGTTKLNIIILGAAIATAEAFGSARLLIFALPSAIGTSEAFGSTRLVLLIPPAGIGTAEVFGGAKVNLTFLLSGITTGEVLGSAVVNLILRLTGISSSEGLGSAQVNLILRLTGITSGEVVGSATMVNFFLAPTGIITNEAWPTPVLIGGGVGYRTAVAGRAIPSHGIPR
jgi:hypothetical protein